MSSQTGKVTFNEETKNLALWRSVFILGFNILIENIRQRDEKNQK